MMKKDQTKTTAEEIIERSGNSFHSKVVKKLRECGWSVLVSPHYSDNFTDKPREIDIIAEKKFDVKGFVHSWLGTLNVRLFIECKYINGDTVFWFDSKDQDRAVDRIMRDTGMDHPTKNVTIQRHHYYQDVPVAKLFASDKGKNEENEMISKAINQNLNATVYYRNRGDLNLAKTPYGHRENVLSYVSYPIIVVSSLDRFHSTDMDGSGVIAPITEPFQLEVNYAYTDKDRNAHSEYFLIDVTSLDKLADFLDKVIEKTDVPAISQKLESDERISRRESQSESQNFYD